MEQEEYRKHFELERDHWWFQGMRAAYGVLLQRAIPRNQQAETLQVLNLGCGAGETSRWLQQFGHVTSIDAAWDALAWAGKRALSNRVQGLAEQLPFRSHTFDLIAGLGLIEHIETDDVALREMARVCRPGGLLLLLTSAHQFLWSHHDRANHHCRRYTAGQLRKLMVGAAWEPFCVSYVNMFLFPVIVTIRVAQRATGWDVRQTSSDLAMPHPWLNAICRCLLYAEALWLRHGTLPFGVSLVCLAKRASDA